MSHAQAHQQQGRNSFPDPNSLVIVKGLVTEYSENGIRGRQHLSLVGRILTKCSRPLLQTQRCWRPLDQIAKEVADTEVDYF